MDHLTLPKRYGDPRHQPKTLAGLGWAEFFEALGRGAVVAEYRSPLPKLVKE